MAKRRRTSPGEIIPYLEMCRREGVSLQRGMNFQLGSRHSVILMSVRPNAPYADRFENDGPTLIYEGHDAPRSPQNPDPKATHQTVCFTKQLNDTNPAASHPSAFECMRR